MPEAHHQAKVENQTAVAPSISQQTPSPAIIDSQPVFASLKGCKVFDTLLPFDVDKYPSCSEWLDSLKSDYSRHTYKSALKRWISWINVTRQAEKLPLLSPDDIITLDNAQVKVLCARYLSIIKRGAKKSVSTHRVRGELSVNSVRHAVIPIKAFLDYNEVSTAWWKKKIKSALPERVTNKLRGYRPVELEKLMDLGDPFDRQNIVLFVAGGERVGGQEGLTFKNIMRLPEGIGILDVYPESEKWHYQVPLSKEALFFIDKCTEHRRSMGERITEDSPLIRNKCKPLTSSVNRPRPIKRNAIYKRMKRLQRLAGLPLSDEIAPDHSFRYFFDTAMMNSECKWEIKELMMGHSPYLSKSYYDKKDPNSRKKLLVEYMKAMDALTITPQFKMTERIAELEKQVEQAPKIEALQDALINKELEFDALKRKVESMPDEVRMMDYVERMLRRRGLLKDENAEANSRD